MRTSNINVSRMSLVTLAWWLWTVCITVAAPALVYRGPAPKHEITGVYRMTWGACACDVLLERGGFFGDTYNGEDWRGTWSLDGDTLTVTESRACGHAITWTARLDPPRRGTRGATGRLEGGGAFALVE